jgi:hypothetical protein
MKQVLLALSVAVVLLTGCKKDEENHNSSSNDCNGYGTMTVSNTSSNPYHVYVNGIYQTDVPGNRLVEFNIYKGSNTVLYALQASGYLLYPTEKTSYFNIVGCEEYGWQIP